MKIFASHQPNLFPHPGYWAKMMRADLWAHNAGVEFSRAGFQNRVKIGYGPEPLWLTLPVAHNDQALLRDVKIADYNHRKWVQRLLCTYRGTAFWKSIEGPIMDTISGALPGMRLVPTLENGIGAIKTALSISTPILDLGEVESSNPSQRNALRTEMAGCDTYLAGPGAHGYLDEREFTKRRLKVIYMDPVPEGPYSGRSVLSAFCHHGPDWYRAVYGG